MNSFSFEKGSTCDSIILCNYLHVDLLQALKQLQLLAVVLCKLWGKEPFSCQLTHLLLPCITVTLRNMSIKSSMQSKDAVQFSFYKLKNRFFKRNLCKSHVHSTEHRQYNYNDKNKNIGRNYKH